MIPTIPPAADLDTLTRQMNQRLEALNALLRNIPVVRNGVLDLGGARIQNLGAAQKSTDAAQLASADRRAASRSISKSTTNAGLTSIAPAPAASGVTLSLVTTDSAGYFMQCDWTMPIDLGTAVAMQRFAVFYADATTTTPAGESDIGGSFTYDLTLATASDGPFAYPSSDVYIEEEICLVNGNLQLTRARSNRVLLPGGLSGNPPGVGDLTIDTSYGVVQTWAKGTLKLECRWAPYYPGIEPVTPTVAGHMYLEVGDVKVIDFGLVPYPQENSGLTPPANLQTAYLEISREDLSLIAPDIDGHITLWVHACNVQDDGEVRYRKHGLQTSSAVIAIVMDAADVDNTPGGIDFALQTRGIGGIKEWRAHDVTIDPALIPGAANKYAVEINIFNDSGATVSDTGGWISFMEIGTDVTPQDSGWQPWDTSDKWIRLRAAAVDADGNTGTWEYSALKKLDLSPGLDLSAADPTKFSGFEVVGGRLRPKADGVYLLVDPVTGSLTPQGIPFLSDFLDGDVLQLIGGQFTIVADAIFANLVGTAMALVTTALQIGGGSNNVQIDATSITLNSPAGAIRFASSGANFDGANVGGIDALTPTSLQVGPNAPYGSVDSSGNAIMASLDSATPIAIASGGTGADNSLDARGNLGLGTAATADIGTGYGEVASAVDSKFYDARAPLSHRHTIPTVDKDVLIPDGSGGYVTDTIKIPDPASLYTGHTGA